MSVAANMRAWRQELGWTQEDAARRAGMRLTTWVRTELGITRNPGLDTLVRIADALDVSLDALVADDDTHPVAS